ncbi:MAG: cytochrome C [Sedimenticola sp.]
MANKRITSPASWLLLCTLGIGGCVAESQGDLGDWFNALLLDVAPAENQLYQEECGSCHFAYQPGLLNTPSWELVMDGLEEHFEDNAELDEESETALRSYLLEHAADRSEYTRSQGVALSQEGKGAVLRVSETPYFLRKHNELPLEWVTGNSEVGSFSRCELCHKAPETGRFDGHEVRIPGVDRRSD